MDSAPSRNPDHPVGQGRRGSTGRPNGPARTHRPKSRGGPPDTAVTSGGMIHAFRGRSRTHHVLLVPAGVLVLALLVAEGLNTGFAPTAAATIVTGGLCVVALFVPPARFFLVAACAVAASLALSVTELQLTQRPENTPWTSGSGPTPPDGWTSR